VTTIKLTDQLTFKSTTCLLLGVKHGDIGQQGYLTKDRHLAECLLPDDSDITL